MTSFTYDLGAGIDGTAAEVLPVAVWKTYLKRLADDGVELEHKNFRKSVVRQQIEGTRYHKEVADILLAPDGEVTVKAHDRGVNTKDLLPTAEEAETIKAGIAAANLPKSIPAPEPRVKELRLRLGATGFYELWDRSQSSVVMVQQRVERDDGKAYLPWSYWSDGHWRMMEPDGPLPFWKPRQKSRVRIMVHEGAKAAEAVTRMLAEKHPWTKELDAYEHWGRIGGAPNSHKANRSEVLREKPIGLVAAADNDQAGVNAVADISKILKEHHLLAVEFDSNFPRGFDLADPWPAKPEWWNGDTYIGPTLDDMLRPATWATHVKEVPTGGKGRPALVHRLTDAFEGEWIYCNKPGVFIHRRFPDRHYSLDEFNKLVRAFSDTKNTADLMINSHYAQIDEMVYRPFRRRKGQQEAEIVSEGGQKKINTYRPSDIEPLEGDPAQFTEFLEYLIPEEPDRTETWRWTATVITGQKPHYGLLLVSETQGVGKSTFGEKMLKPIVGPTNTSTPSETAVVDSAFNDWAAHKQLVVIHEIYSGHNWKSYDKLKSIITDDAVTINKKYIPPYDLENHVNILACSNSHEAIRLTVSDRRWLVPRVTEEKRPASYWSGLNKWLVEERGLEIIRWHAEEWLKSNEPVLMGQDAPWTAIKRSMIVGQFSAGGSVVHQLLQIIDDILSGNDKKSEEKREEWKKAKQLRDGTVFTTDEDLVRFVRNQLYSGHHDQRVERALTLRKVAKASGWHVGDQRIRTRAWGEHRFNGRLVFSNGSFANLDPISLAKQEGEEAWLPLDLSPFIGL